MNKKITKNKNTDLEVNKSELRIAQMREAVNEVTNIFFETEEAEDIYREIDEMGNIWNAKNEKERKSLVAKRLRLGNRLSHIKLYPWENLIHLALSVKESTTPITSLRIALINEYGPKTATELALIEGMAIAHYNFIRNTGVLNALLMVKDGIKITLHADPAQMKAAEEAAKAVDMAYRQFTNSIALLREIRQPQRKKHV